MKMIMKIMCAAFMMVALYGCGSSDGDSTVTDSYRFPAGKATLAFSALSTARLTAPISGVDFSIKLPAGMSVAMESGVSSQIETASVTPGGALTGTNLSFGTYSASSRTARLTMVTTSNTYRSGEFLRLVCTVAPNTSITYGDLVALNSPVTITKATGYDAATVSTVVLTNKVKVTIGVIR